jgi:serine/threonine protein kinase
MNHPKTPSKPSSVVPPDSHVADPMIGTTLGEFIIEKKIGAGAMGEVYLGKHKQTGAAAAIKLITDRNAADDGFIARFKREIDILMGLDHQNIARAIGYEIEKTPMYLAMEYIAGPNLADVLHKRSAMFEEDVLNIGMQIARGLAHAYNEAGLIHRDIKPMNILIEQHRRGEREGNFMEPQDRVKIIDFGLAKSTDGEDQRLTMTGIVMGTPAYMSPEQIRCESTIDFHTDMYAVGASMYHMLTGEVPFKGNAPAVIMTGHLTQPVPDPGDLVRSLNPLTRKLVMTAMAKQPRQRFSDYRAMISACEKALKALAQGPGTVRLLRKPMIRGGINENINPSAEATEFQDFQALPGDRAADRIDKKDPKAKATDTHRRSPSVTTSQIFKASSNVTGGTEALESKTPLAVRQINPIFPGNGSEALRKIMTDKIEKVRTTARFKKNQTRMQALDIEVRRGLPSLATGERQISEALAANAPAIVLLIIIIALVVIYFAQ